MDEGDRSETGGEPGDRIDPDTEETSGREDASDQNPDAEPDRISSVEAAEQNADSPSTNRTADPQSTDRDADPQSTDRGSGSAPTASGGAEASDEANEAEERDTRTETHAASGPDDSNSRIRETGVEGKGGIRTTRESYPPETRRTDDRESLRHRFRHDNEGALMWIREMLSSVAIVLVLGLLLFALSGVWPPMVAVESPSMEPNMNTGDLVFVTDPGRFAPDAASNDIGVVTYEEGVAADYRTFGSYGSVVIFQPPDRIASPIIHRAMFHVEEGENWYERADSRYHSADNCGELQHCPAPHGGFITLGDNNGRYDQASGLAEPVRSEWVTGVARVRVPYLGYVRLIATGQAEPGDVFAMTGGFRVDNTADKGLVSGGTNGYETVQTAG
ncbi:S26 family signal peptidase [Halorubrum sp. DTA46]|uniref:S26 family signal peptidase n=1 Tax=Halorubrum sp. DTA46 TaxID=3402162 RepID=UPI003AAB0432